MSATQFIARITIPSPLKAGESGTVIADPIGGTFDSGNYALQYDSGSSIYVEMATDFTSGASLIFNVAANHMPPMGSWTLRLKLIAAGTYLSDVGGQITVAQGDAPIPPSVLCFKQGTNILTWDATNKKEEYREIQYLQVGDLVKTTDGKYRAINHIMQSKLYNQSDDQIIKDRLYKCTRDAFPQLFEELIITGAHSILVKHLTDTERESIMEMYGNIYVTDDHYRLPACIDARTNVYKIDGIFDIYNFSLKNECIYGNYGVYANGLLVECTSKHHLTNE
jgi:hypothetical protein